MVLAGAYPLDRALAHAHWAQRYRDQMDPIRSAAHIGRAAHYMGMAQRAQSAFGARLPIAHTPAYLRDSQTTGRMHPMKLALPDDCARLKKIVASVINVDKDAKVTGFGSWDTSNVEDMSYMFFVAKGVRLDTDSQNMMMKWDTSKVKSMYKMFKQTGENSEWGGVDGEHHYLADYITQGWDKSSVESGKEYNA